MAPPKLEKRVNLKRQRCLTSSSTPKAGGNCVIYWMDREQRAEDNWALLRACELANESKVAVVVAVNMVPNPTHEYATERAYSFQVKGLRETETKLRQKGIPMYLFLGTPTETIPKFAQRMKAIAVVCDMMPLRAPQAWCAGVAKKLANVPLIQVDAHNVVPVWEASDKQEVGARTIRKKIQDKLPEFLTEFPPLPKQDVKLLQKLGGMPKPANWTQVLQTVKMDRSVKEVSWIVPGATGGADALAKFCKPDTLAKFLHRNDPLLHSQSGLGPWYHYGQISPQRAALAVSKAGVGKATAASKEFLEESVVRRELSDNFCFYNPNYDKVKGAAGWAVETLTKHTKDKREHLYTEAQLDKAKTHDALWNGAQNELRGSGKLHGFMRMYWAKKILEWTKTPEEALRIGIKFNDTYALDGRDPNGYTGVAWSVTGAHDMGWTERPIFGKIRYMNYAGCTKKFNVRAYEERWKEPQDVNPASLAKDAPAAAIRKNRGAQTKEGGNPKKRSYDTPSSEKPMKKQRVAK